jgi:hypothetical protein
MNRPFTSVCEDALRTAGIDFRAAPTGKGLRLINKIARASDDSHLWPICGAFSATDRAINRLRGDYRPDSLLEYAYALDAEMSLIVNGGSK